MHDPCLILRPNRFGIVLFYGESADGARAATPEHGTRGTQKLP
jgi:hypothetical protein